jgi:hypothetical protein
MIHIAFKFEYIHDNGLFTRLLNRIQELSAISISLHRDGIHYKIEASGSQAELEALAEQVSSLVPQSLFLRHYTMEEVHKEEEDRDTLLALLTQKKPSFQIPFCPECQRRVTQTLDPFIPCTVCGFSESTLSLDALKSFTGLTADSTDAFFRSLADSLSETGELSLPTYNGVRHFSLLHLNVYKYKGIVFGNPADISERFLITQGELDSLMMVEKPSVRLKPKLRFRAEYELKEPFYPVFFSDDKITLALMTALKEKSIDAVFCDRIPALRTATALEEHLIITPGRDMLPWKTSYDLKHVSFCEYNNYQSFGDQNTIQVDTDLDLPDQPYLRYVAEHEADHFAKAIRFEPAHAALRSIVVERSLESKALCGIHLSRENVSQLFSFSPKIGYTPMVLFRDEALSQPKAMLEAIASMNESGTRLIDNFKNTFPELYEKIENTVFHRNTDLSDMTKLWSLAAVFIGLYEGDDALKAMETLEATAIEFNGKSGPRIDYKVIHTEQGYQLDLRLAIRSAMSFKLAGLDDYLLSFGFIDSLADFIAQQAEDADANIGIDGVTLSGSLFENRQLLMRTYNGLSVNYPVYRNERLSSDNANVALGAITLGSE